MSLRTYLVVALALVFGISSAMGINVLIRNAKSGESVEKVSIVVAVADVKRFVPLTAANLALKEIPKATAPRGALTRIEDAVDRISMIPVSKQDYILDQLLSKKGSKTFVAAIPPGMRAIPIQHSNVSAFVQPGNQVDILFTHKDKNGDHKTVTLFTLIDVIAVNGSLIPSLDVKSDGKEPQSVNVLLNQKDAEELEAVQKQGTIRLALRSPGDTQPAVVTLVADLKPAVQPAASPPESHAPPPIRFIRGFQEDEKFILPAKQR